ncbi:MAG: hypothetical protein F6K35_21415 [Okeania sp. SIO2H7]|nr:hypothetical protein [Okeania sp. SIO2H7]
MRTLLFSFIQLFLGDRKPLVRLIVCFVSTSMKAEKERFVQIKNLSVVIARRSKNELNSWENLKLAEAISPCYLLKIMKIWCYEIATGGINEKQIT